MSKRLPRCKAGKHIKRTNVDIEISYGHGAPGDSRNGKSKRFSDICMECVREKLKEMKA
jgi:hypothetical protein